MMVKAITHHVVSITAVLPLALVLISWIRGDGFELLNPWSNYPLELWPMALSALFAVVVVTVNAGFGIATTMRATRPVTE